MADVTLASMACDQLALSNALVQLKHVIEQKYGSPILTHVKITGKADHVIVQATDLYNVLTAKLLGSGAGELALPHKTLSALVEPDSKKKPKKGAEVEARPVEIGVDAESAAQAATAYAEEMEAYAKRYEAWAAEKPADEHAYYAQAPTEPEMRPAKVLVVTPELKGACLSMDVADWPSRPAITWGGSSVFECGDLLAAMEWAVRAVSTDDGRPHLNGLLFTGKDTVGLGGGLVATDGHRLHYAPLEGIATDDLLVPLKACGIVLRLLKLCKDDLVRVTLGAEPQAPEEIEKEVEPTRWVRFAISGWTLETRMTDARFPPFEKVVPSLESIRAGDGVILRADPEVLASRVKRLSKISENSALLLTVTGSAVNLKVDNPDGYGAEVDVPAEVVQRTSGEELRSGFNARYMLDALLGMGESVQIAATGPKDATRLDGATGNMAVVMPMRL
jgi:DNA polymerase III sliding clamp (beta) subunit (PCNA family)